MGQMTKQETIRQEELLQGLEKQKNIKYVKGDEIIIYFSKDHKIVGNFIFENQDEIQIEFNESEFRVFKNSILYITT